MPIEFASSPRPTLGVEVELELVDRETRELVSGAHEILTEIAQALPDGEPGKAKAELLQSTIEIITGICHTVREAKHDLAASLDDLRPYTDRDGLLADFRHYQRRRERSRQPGDVASRVRFGNQFFRHGVLLRIRRRKRTDDRPRARLASR